MQNNLTAKEIKVERLKRTLSDIMEYNTQHLHELEDKKDISETNLIYFVTALGHVIYNPYQDITGRESVNPFEYYNEDNLLEMLDQYDDKTDGQLVEYEMEGTLKIKLRTTLEDSQKPNESTMIAMLEEDLQDFLRESPWQIEQIEMENFKVELRKK